MLHSLDPAPAEPILPDSRRNELSASGAKATRPPVTGNAAAGLSGLLEALGVADSTTRGTVEEAVVSYLADHGLSASVLGLRWGTLTLTADPQSARMLGFEHDNLMSTIEASHPGAVSSIRIQVRR